MSSPATNRSDGLDPRVERCSACRADTEHDVAIEIRQESTHGDHPEFSREPYRVATCRRCGTETAMRMNNA